MVRIRKYAASDWEAIAWIHDAARMQELALADLQAAYLPLSIAAEREDLFGYELYVAEVQGQALGFVAFTEEELAWLYVHPDYHRQGIGRELTEFALKKMSPGVQKVEVLRGNEPARGLYRSLDFGEDTLVFGHMPGNEAFTVAVWQLCRRR